MNPFICKSSVQYLQNTGGDIPVRLKISILYYTQKNHKLICTFKNFINDSKY